MSIAHHLPSDNPSVSLCGKEIGRDGLEIINLSGMKCTPMVATHYTCPTCEQIAWDNAYAKRSQCLDNKRKR